MAYRYGIDLGGTKILLAAFDKSGTEVFRKRVPTPQGDYVGTVQTIADLVKEADTIYTPNSSLGIGTPGSVSQLTGRMINCNSVCLNGQPLQEDIETAIGRHIRIANDANCFTLSEATDGAGAGFSVVFGVILGTGVGGGIVVNRQILSGRHGIAGEWGHNCLPRSESFDANAAPSSAEPSTEFPKCYCGKRGCIETYLSGPNFVRDYHFIGGNPSIASAERVIALCQQGDDYAREALHRYCRRLAKALSSVINILDPDVIVLGGGMSNIDAIYQLTPPLLSEFVFSDSVRTPIVRNVHGDSSGVRGAAWLWH